MSTQNAGDVLLRKKNDADGKEEARDVDDDKEVKEIVDDGKEGEREIVDGTDKKDIVNDGKEVIGSNEKKKWHAVITADGDFLVTEWVGEEEEGKTAEEEGNIIDDEAQDYDERKTGDGKNVKEEQEEAKDEGKGMKTEEGGNGDGGV